MKKHLKEDNADANDLPSFCRPNDIFTCQLTRLFKVTVDLQGPILSRIVLFTPNSRLLLYLNFPKKIFQKLKT